MMKRTLVLAVIAAALLFPGCRSNLIQVQTEFNRLTMNGMESGVLELKVINLNKFALSIEDLDYTMLLSKDTLASGTRSEPIQVGAQDTTLADFPFEMRMDVADTSFFMQRPGLLADTVMFKLSGRYLLPGFMRKSRIPFKYSKGVPMGELVKGSATDLQKLFNR